MAVDAGTHLAAIIRIFEEHLPKAVRRGSSQLPTPLAKTAIRPASKVATSPVISPHTSSVPAYPTVDGKGNQPISLVNPVELAKTKLVLSTGPFASLELPFESAKANAAYVLRNLISTYLITHPHLDHLSGFAVNTASFQHTSRPKRLAALPSTIDAIKTHIFNDVIWPNLSDEEGGVGLVSYMRLVEGGNVALGEGEGRGYIEVCDGLAAKCWSISHGHCMKRRFSHHGGSNSMSAPEINYQYTIPERVPQSRSPPTSIEAIRYQSRPSQSHPAEQACVYDSSALFIRDDETGKEVLVFGDVEPDSISLSPRTDRVWTDAATKIVAGLLTGILIECSYDDSQPDEMLFGHLAPRHLIAELQVLAEKVSSIRPTEDFASQRKRKRQSNGLESHEEGETRQPQARSPRQMRRKTRISSISPTHNSALTPSDHSKAEITCQIPRNELVAGVRPLEGVQVIIIHVKDNLKDGPEVSDTIMKQLYDYDKETQLGCTFTMSESGASIWL